MKQAIFLSLLIVNSYLLFGQSFNRTFENTDGSIKLLGEVTLDRLKEDPFNEWFQSNYDEYTINQASLKEFPSADSVTIFMGSWCGDSKREVPRFVKILESHEFNFRKLKIICLNNGFQNYKQAPEREERGNDIHRVPTFIFHDDKGEEIGRIVEEPVQSLESDMKAIITGETYSTAYPAVADLINQFKNNSLDELEKMQPKLIKKYKSMVSSVYSLNTYGYVLWTSFQLTKAEFVFELNQELHPESTTVYSSLASLKNTLGKKKEARKLIDRGLSIDQENDRLLSLKEKLTVKI